MLQRTPMSMIKKAPITNKPRGFISQNNYSSLYSKDAKQSENKKVEIKDFNPKVDAIRIYEESLQRYKDELNINNKFIETYKQFNKITNYFANLTKPKIKIILYDIYQTE
jgi:hypothetical protein